MFVRQIHFSFTVQPTLYLSSYYCVLRCGIRAVALEELILENLRQTVKFATEHENEFAQHIMNRTLAKQQEGIKTLQKMLSTKEHRTKELDGIIKKLYEDKLVF